MSEHSGELTTLRAALSRMALGWQPKDVHGPKPMWFKPMPWLDHKWEPMTEDEATVVAAALIEEEQ